MPTLTKLLAHVLGFVSVFDRIVIIVTRLKHVLDPPMP